MSPFLQRSNRSTFRIGLAGSMNVDDDSEDDLWYIRRGFACEPLSSYS